MTNYIVDRDITFCLFKYLDDRNKLNLLLVNKSIYLLGNRVNFEEYHNLNKIIKSPLFDNFESVIVWNRDIQIYDWHTKLPKKIQKLNIELFSIECEIKNLPENIRTLKIRNDVGFVSAKILIPHKVEKLWIGQGVEIIGQIPDTVTKMELYDINLNRIVIPQSVKKLVLGEFGHHTKKFIPKSVTDLTLNIFHYGHYNEIEFDCSDIPDGIKYLFFGSRFNFKLVGKLPKSVKMLFFYGLCYYGPIEDQLNTEIKCIWLGHCCDGHEHDDYYKKITISEFNKKINYFGQHNNYNIIFEKIPEDENNDVLVLKNYWK